LARVHHCADALENKDILSLNEELIMSGSKDSDTLVITKVVRRKGPPEIGQTKTREEFTAETQSS